jgi:hypothetical protein
MEADWEIEIGGDAPVIEAFWPGFVDLRRYPEQVYLLPEAVQLQSLAEALVQLNAPASPVWTAKCDLWPIVEADELDLDELDAPRQAAVFAWGCYIDLLPRSDRQRPLAAMVSSVCQRICELLTAIPLHCCRADLVIRQAWIDAGQMEMGITAYLTACGPTAADARATLAAALAAFAISTAPPATAASKLQ